MKKRTFRNFEMETDMKKSLIYQGLSQFRQAKVINSSPGDDRL